MISIVVPVFNEEESLEAFYSVLVTELQKLKRDYEILFIDDGSSDPSLKILKQLEKKDKAVRIFSFRKNRGKAEALTLGFQKAKGDYVITLDADLQDRPSEIPKLLDQLHDFDVVCGWRKDRKDPGRKVISSKLFNYLPNKFWGLSLHDYNCGLKGYTMDAAKSLYLYGGMHRFIPALAYQQGFSVTEISVVHDQRKYGKSKYGFSKIFKDIPDIFTMLFLTKYGSRPLHFFGLMAAPMLTIGILILLYLTVIWIGGSPIGRRPLLFLGMLLVISGLQIFFTGFLADMILSSSNKKEREMQLRYASD
jgi:glycosyltransferase involved in cell wall biosynthesis